MLKQAVAYLRVSTDGQDTKSQRFKIEQYVKDNGYEIIDWFVDEAFSGALEERPELLRLEKWVPNNEGKSVIMVGIDRLARDMFIFMKFTRLFKEYSVTPVYLNFQPTGDLATDTLIQNILATFADYERSVIFERFNRGRMAKLNTGKIASGGPPKYGLKFRKVPIGGDRFDQYYEINEAEAKNVQLLFKLILTGKFRLQEVGREMTRKGIKNRSGSIRWAPSTVRDLLTDPIYKGEFHYGKTKNMGSGKRKHRIVNPLENHIIIKVPPVISVNDFDKVQRIIANYRLRTSPRQTKKNNYLLSGLIKCGKCHYRYSGWSKDSVTVEKKWYYYRCNSISQYNEVGNYGSCGNSKIMGYQAEDIVWNELKYIIANPEKVNITKDKEQKEALKIRLQEEAGEILNRLNDISKKKRRIADQFLEDIIEKSLLVSIQNELKKEEADLEQKNYELVEKLVLLEYDTQGETLIPPPDFDALYEPTFERKRELVRKYISEIRVLPTTPTKLEIIFNIPIKPKQIVVATNKDRGVPVTCYYKEYRIIRAIRGKGFRGKNYLKRNVTRYGVNVVEKEINKVIGLISDI